MMIRKGIGDIKINFLTVTFILFPLFITTFAQEDYSGNKIKTDIWGNSYLAGRFKSKTLSFGKYSLKNSGGSDIFLAKYDSFGKITWAKNIGGSGDEEILSMDIDNNCNISLLASSSSNVINHDGSQLKNDKREIVFNVEFNSLGKLVLSKIVKEIQQTSNRSYKDSGSDTSLTIISPLANDKLKVGTKAKIEWISENVVSVLLVLSSNYCSTWQQLASVYYGFENYLFVVPNSPSDSCLIRISDYNNPDVADTSGSFKIFGELYWEIKQSGDYNSIFTSVFSMDSHTCLVAGYNGLSKTTDGGETWVGSLNGIGLFDVFFLNDSIGWTVGFYGNIYKTTNGGDNWIRQNNTFNFHLLKIFFHDEKNGYMISDRYFLKTTDGGESWIMTQPTEHVLRAMFFINKDIGWIAGHAGVILKTTDAGLTWDYQQLNSTEYGVLTSLYFTDENTGWSSGAGLDVDGGVVLKTYTGGNQWSLIHNGYNRFIYSITFISQDSGWAVGDEGAMFRTTNGGENWELQGSGTLASLRSIDMQFNRGGWSVGDDVVLKLINNSTSNPLPVELSGFEANSNNSKVELNWTTVTEINNRGFEIERKISGEWESVGFVKGNGTITKPVKYFFNDDLKNLSFKGNILYRLRQIDFDGSYAFSNEVMVNINSIPIEYSLSQNYPNPFNPSTVIKYSLSENTLVVLKIYDILGTEVKTLVNKEMPAGTHSINFEAVNLSSGTYLYTIQAGNFVQTKKMLLVK